MKKIFPFLILFGFLQASIVETQEYKDAMVAYKAKEYQKSYELFWHIYNKNLDNENVNYYLGRSAFMLKLYDDAINAYERVLIKYPDNIRSKLEMAICYFMEKNYVKSKKLFLEVKQQNIPNEVAKNVEAYLAQIDTLTPKNFVSGVMMAGYIYDTNPASDPQSDYINNATVNKSGSDSAHQEIITFTDIYDIGETSGFKLKFNSVFLNKTMFNQGDKNVFFYGLNPSVVYEKDATTYEAGVMYDRLWYGSDAYVYSKSFLSTITYLLDEQTNIAAGLKLQQKKYIQSANQIKNAQNSSLNLSLTRMISEKMTLGVGIALAKERQIDGAFEPEVDYDEYSLNTSLTYQISEEYTSSFSLGYKNSKYEDFNPNPSLNHTNNREDKLYSSSLSLIAKLPYSGLFMQGVASFTKSDSNYVENDNDKFTFTINFIKPF